MIHDVDCCVWIKGVDFIYSGFDLLIAEDSQIGHKAVPQHLVPTLFRQGKRMSAFRGDDLEAACCEFGFQKNVLRLISGEGSFCRCKKGEGDVLR